MALVAALVVGGCTVVGGSPRDPAPGGTPISESTAPVEGEALRTYGGNVTFDGNRISLLLELVGRGSDYSARLSIPSLDLDAGGAGTVEGDQLSVELSYAGSCPGTLRLTGRFQESMRRIEGRLTASDCTGKEAGAVMLLLRPGG